MWLVLLLLFSTVIGQDRPSEITVDGTTLPLRDCRGPVFSSHDAGLVALAAAGVALLVFSLLLSLPIALILCLLTHHHPKARLVACTLLFLFLLLGAPMVGTGFYYGRWEKVYDVHTGCDSLPTITAPSTIPSAALETPVNYTVVYFGDSSVSIDTVSVWQLMQGENPDLLVTLGDYDYCDDPTLWQRHLKAFFPDVPIVPVIGNHELHLWDDYSQAWDNFTLWQNMNSTDWIVCDGIKYVNYWCMVRGIFIAFSSVGTKCGSYFDHTWHEQEQERMLQVSRDRFQNPYIVCAWHKNYDKFQLATQRDETGYNIYDICSDYGALTLSGHDHVYGRTHVITNAQDPNIVQTCSNSSTSCVYDLTSNGTIISVSGKGGWDNPDLDPTLVSNPWWAATSNDHKEYGALFCKYNLNGEGLVYCYFKDTAGKILDEFTFKQKKTVLQI